MPDSRGSEPARYEDKLRARKPDLYVTHVAVSPEERDKLVDALRCARAALFGLEAEAIDLSVAKAIHAFARLDGFGG